jgi:MoaA/NifB/PqqE/SkfB family radical SAM enzyme
MTHIAALPDMQSDSIPGAVLTFVVPAPNGCDLACPHCYIKLRHEDATATDLTPADYARFIEEVAAAQPVAALCIQGYEPLLPESFAYTRRILETGRRLGIRASLVSNGTHLAERAFDLAGLAPAKLAVSLESADPAVHDQSRGLIGAFERTIAGIERALTFPQLRDRLAVASILFPKKCHRLMGMPALLRRLGVKRWVITLLQRVGKGEEIGGPVGDRRRMYQDILALQAEAEAHGIDLVLDDEADRLRQTNGGAVIAELAAVRIRRLAQAGGVVRLLPTGQCSMGTEILTEVTDKTPRWVPSKINAGAFITAHI